MKKIIPGFTGLILDARPWDPLDIGRMPNNLHLPILRTRGLYLCDSFDRMLERYPIVYHTEDPSNIRKTVEIEAEQLCAIAETLSDIQYAHWVDTASGFALDALGSALATPRRPGESDFDYRSRLKAVLPTFTGGGTISHLKKLVAGIFAKYGVTETEVLVNDGYTRTWHGPSYEYILKLNGNANDWEGNHNGVEVGSPTYASARFDDGLSEPDSSNYIRIPDDTEFDTASFAIWAWVYSNDVSGTQVIKIKQFGETREWYLQIVDGQVQGRVFTSGSAVLVNSGTDVLETDKWYFIALSYDDSTKQATLYIVEDGRQGRMVALDKYTGSAGSGSRVMGAADIYLGIDYYGNYEWEGIIDHVGYVTSELTDRLADELAYCAPGLDHYAHFNITINIDVSVITADDWAYAASEVRRNKAAGVTFEGFTNGPREEDIDVLDEGHIYHTSEITYTESLNITAPG